MSGLSASRENMVSRGRDFEILVLGNYYDWRNKEPYYGKPTRLGLPGSLSVAIERNWTDYAEAVTKGEEYCHNPTKPKMGRTHDIWAAVKNWLPSTVEGDSYIPLNLYVSLGKTSLDLYYGVDFFFWWRGGYATVDISRRRKDRLGTLKADFLFGPDQLKVSHMLYFGKQVAELLVERSLRYKEENWHNHLPLQEVRRRVLISG